MIGESPVFAPLIVFGLANPHDGRIKAALFIPAAFSREHT